jgi:hypothetical protein
VRDSPLQQLVARRAAGDEKAAVGQERVPGAEQVVRRRHEPTLAGGRVVEQRGERSGVELLLVVARPRDDQHFAGRQQRRVNAVDGEVLGQLDDVPAAVLGLVLGAVDQQVVPELVNQRDRRRHVDDQ